MAKQLVRREQPATSELHPLVYIAAIALAFWYVVAVWLLFSGDYAGLTLVVGMLVLVAVGIPVLIWLTWRRFLGAQATASECGTFREWCAAEMETAQGRISARDAAIQVLLPLAAVSFGITALGLILLFSASSGGA
jgi:hypothetical protein